MTTRTAAALGRLVLPLLLAAALAGGAWAQPAATADPLLTFTVDAQAPAVDLSVRFQATGETRAIQGRRLLVGVDAMYLRSATAAALLNAGRYWQGTLRRLELKVGEQVFAMTADSRLVVASDGETLLPVPVLDLDGDLWLPLVLLTEVVGPAVGDRVAWDSQQRRLQIGVPEHTVTGMRTETLGRTTVVHVACRDALAYRTASPSPGVVELKIYGGAVDPAAVQATRRRGLLLGARSRQTGRRRGDHLHGRRAGGSLPHLHRRRRARDRAGAGGGAGRQHAGAGAPRPGPAEHRPGAGRRDQRGGGAHGGGRRRPRRPRRGRRRSPRASSRRT